MRYICKKKYTLTVNNTSILYCILIFFLVTTIANAEDPPSDLQELLQRLEKQHSGTETLAVQFRQEKLFSFMNKPVVSKGFMLFSSPNKIRFDITEPFHTTLLDDGEKFGRYELIDGKWRPLQLNGSKGIKLVMGQIGQWMQGKFSQQSNIFEFSMSVEDPNAYVSLILEPRHKKFRQYIEKIRVSISAPPAYKVTRIDFFEPGSDSFAFNFVQEIVNQKLPKDCFSNPLTAILCKELFSKKQQKKQI